MTLCLLTQVDSSTVARPDGPRLPFDRCTPACQLGELCVESDQGPMCVAKSARPPRRPPPPSPPPQVEEPPAFEPPSEPRPRDLRPVVAEKETPVMGTPGNWVVTSELSIGFSHAWYSENNTGDSTAINLSPSLSRFVSEHVAVEGGFTFSYASTTRTETSLVGVTAGLRFHQPLGLLASLWPGATLSVANVASGIDAREKQEQLLVLGTLSLPLLIHPVPHFFLGVGPEVSLSKAIDVEGTIYVVRFPFFIGGWF